jgi:type IV pilus assembly protein PilW
MKPPRMTRHRRPAARQRGMTLVEMLVAITIGLLLLLAISAVFINMKRAFTSQDQLSQLQDNERLAVEVLTTTIQSAGYFTNPVTNTADILAAASPTWDVGQGIAGSSGTAPASDTVSVRYRTAPGDGIMDCLGQTNTGGAESEVVNTFSISANNELMCAVNGGAATALVSNISTMSVVYAVDGLDTGNADRYLSAADVTTGGFWQRVKGVRITLGFVNPYVATDPPVTWAQTINLMNKT